MCNCFDRVCTKAKNSVSQLLLLQHSSVLTSTGGRYTSAVPIVQTVQCTQCIVWYDILDKDIESVHINHNIIDPVR